MSLKHCACMQMVVTHAVKTKVQVFHTKGIYAQCNVQGMNITLGNTLGMNTLSFYCVATVVTMGILDLVNLPLCTRLCKSGRGYVIVDM